MKYSDVIHSRALIYIIAGEDSVSDTEHVMARTILQTNRKKSQKVIHVSDCTLGDSPQGTPIRLRGASCGRNTTTLFIGKKGEKERAIKSIEYEHLP